SKTGGGPYGWTWNHLWYVIYLWFYTLALAVLLPFFESKAGRAFRVGLASRLRGTALLWLPAVPFAIEAFLLQQRYPETHALGGDWFAHAMYFTAFVYGYLIGTDASLWEEIMRLRWKSLVCALACLALFMGARAFLTAGSPEWLLYAVRLAR